MRKQAANRIIGYCLEKEFGLLWKNCRDNHWVTIIDGYIRGFHLVEYSPKKYRIDTRGTPFSIGQRMLRHYKPLDFELSFYAEEDIKVAKWMVKALREETDVPDWLDLKEEKVKLVDGPSYLWTKQGSAIASQYLKGERE